MVTLFPVRFTFTFVFCDVQSKQLKLLFTCAPSYALQKLLIKNTDTWFCHCARSLVAIYVLIIWYEYSWYSLYGNNNNNLTNQKREYERKHSCLVNQWRRRDWCLDWTAEQKVTQKLWSDPINWKQKYLKRNCCRLIEIY